MCSDKKNESIRKKIEEMEKEIIEYDKDDENIHDENIQLVKYDHSIENTVRRYERDERDERDERELTNILKPVTHLIEEGQSENKKMLEVGFGHLAAQNSKLLEDNHQLKDRLSILQEQLENISTELAEQKEKEKAAQNKKTKRKNRTRLPKRDPITFNIYNFLISKTEATYDRKKYLAARLRLALALLAITGIRISELLPLTMSQVQTLFVESWIAIDRKKRGPASHKAYLTSRGVKVIRDRAKDFEFLLNFKNEDSFIFTPENSNKPLEREWFTNLVNQFIRDTAQEIQGKPNLSSHSFRIGFITELWRDTSDIEFVRQVVGHAKIDTTAIYVQHLPDDERERRMKKIKQESQEN